MENPRLLDAINQIKKIKQNQTKIYGIMAHGLVPEELIYAAGGFPLRLSLAGDKNSATEGIDYLTPATCSFARSTLGNFKLKNPLYDELDTIIASNYCNGELCATEYLSDYFNIPNLSIVFPSTKSQSALKFMVAELNHFKEDLERISGNKINDSAIKDAIAIYNQERRLFQEILTLQADKGLLLSGSECSELVYKHFLYGVEASIENLKTLIASLKEKSPLDKGKRIIFAGNGVPIGDNIINLIENYGLTVSKNLTWTGIDYYDSLVEENTNNIDALAKYYLNAENSGRMILSDNYLKDLIKIYQDTNADGIIFYLVKYCSIFPSVISHQLKQQLSENDIPFVEIERDYGVTTDAQLQTRLQAFKEMIE